MPGMHLYYTDRETISFFFIALAVLVTRASLTIWLIHFNARYACMHAHIVKVALGRVL